MIIRRGREIAGSFCGVFKFAESQVVYLIQWWRTLSDFRKFVLLFLFWWMNEWMNYSLKRCFCSTSCLLNHLLECFLCKLQREVKQRFDMARKELESMKYHPLRDYKSIRSGDQESSAKRKKLKTSINCKLCKRFSFFLLVGSILLQT